MWSTIKVLFYYVNNIISEVKQNASSLKTNTDLQLSVSEASNAVD